MARPLSNAARTKMLQAAQDVIVRLGMDSCTIDEVARRSGVAKTTIYRHFRNADELSLSAVDELIGDMITPDSGDFRSDLRATVMGFRSIVSHDSFRRLFVSILKKSLDDPAFAMLYERTQEVRHTALRRVIQRAMARGEVDPAIDLEQAMFFVQGPFVAKRLIEQSELTEDDIDVFIELIVKALAPA